MWEFWRSTKDRRTTSPERELRRADSPTTKFLSGNINFKDLNIRLDADEDDETETGAEDESNVQPNYKIVPPPKTRPEKNKLVIIMVGLPGRGKTFLCNKLKCYLNWLGHHTLHVNVGSYRRAQRVDSEVQDFHFFDSKNAVSARRGAGCGAGQGAPPRARTREGRGDITRVNARVGRGEEGGGRIGSARLAL